MATIGKYFVLTLAVVAIWGNLAEGLLVDPASITMSGFSSGGGMTIQFHLSHSRLLKGVGVFSGLPYACDYFTNSSHCHLISDQTYLEEIYQQEQQRNIDLLSNVIGSKVFVYHGALDTQVMTVLGRKLAAIYERLGANVTTDFSVQGEHGFPTTYFGTSCPLNALGSHFISNCSYNGAFHALNNLYGGSLLDPTGSPVELAGIFTTFNQSSYLPPDVATPESISLDPLGYVYTPSGCLANSNTSCKLHVALHGCRQSISLIGDAFARQSGYMEVAELNNIIILYPQATPTPQTSVGCWDIYGYLHEADFLNKKSPQIQTIYNMIQAYL